MTTSTESTLGTTIDWFDVDNADTDDIARLQDSIYTHKLVVLKNQDLSPENFVRLSKMLGEPDIYYESMYHHPEYPEIFVSSNVKQAGQAVGVPRTGQFWHSDLAFKNRPIALTLFYPQIIPTENRGTYFINMADAYRSLGQEMKETIAGTWAWHSARRYIKVKPSDVYRPICEVLADIEREVPPASHPTVFEHPVTGELVLYVMEAGTYELKTPDGELLPASVLQDLFRTTGQLDDTFEHPGLHLQTFTKGDLMIWDNRVLLHRARHSTVSAAAKSFRITVHDQHPFHDGVAH